MAEHPIILRPYQVRAALDGRLSQVRLPVPQPPAECSINYMLGEESWLPVEQRSPVRRTFEAWGGPLFYNRPAGHLCGSFDITPRFQPRDRLWVRENFATSDAYTGPGIIGVEYAADGSTLAYANGELHHKEHGCAQYTGPWKPSIHMPRYLSRLTLIVEAVKVERLQDISEADAQAEGATSRPNSYGFRNAHEGWSMDWSRVGQPDPFGKNGVLTEHCISLGRASLAFANYWIKLHGEPSWEANPFVVAISFRVIRANIDSLQTVEGAA